MKGFGLGIVICLIAAGVLYIAWIQPKIDDLNQQVTRIDNAYKEEKRTTERLTDEKKRLENQRDSLVRSTLTERIQKAGLSLGISLKVVLSPTPHLVDHDADTWIDSIVRQLAFPLYAGSDFIGVVSLTFNPRERKGVGIGIFAPSEVGLSVDEVQKRQADVRGWLVSHVRDGDWVYEISWTVEPHLGTFSTYLVLDQNGAEKFESLLFYSPGDNETLTTPSRQAGSTRITWQGRIRNALGWEAVAWEAVAAYDWANGAILRPPKGEFTKAVSFLPLWHVTVRDVNIPPVHKLPRGVDVTDATFRFGWTTGFEGALKVSPGRLTVEAAGVNTGQSYRTVVYELTGDGNPRILIQ